MVVGGVNNVARGEGQEKQFFTFGELPEKMDEIRSGGNLNALAQLGDGGGNYVLAEDMGEKNEDES
jgi:hypothetical protein